MYNHRPHRPFFTHPIVVRPRPPKTIIIPPKQPQTIIVQQPYIVPSHQSAPQTCYPPPSYSPSYFPNPSSYPQSIPSIRPDGTIYGNPYKR